MRNSSGQVNIWVDLSVGLLLNIKRECFINGIINCAFGSSVFYKTYSIFSDQIKSVLIKKWLRISSA